MSAENKEFKLKSPSEIGKLKEDELINYIDRLHSLLKNYQIIIDQAVRVNENIRS